LHSSTLEYGQAAGFGEDANESFGSIKGEEFLDYPTVLLASQGLWLNGVC
jgi:hypothetical protein